MEGSLFVRLELPDSSAPLCQLRARGDPPRRAAPAAHFIPSVLCQHRCCGVAPTKRRGVEPRAFGRLSPLATLLSVRPLFVGDAPERRVLVSPTMSTDTYCKIYVLNSSSNEWEDVGTGFAGVEDRALAVRGGSRDLDIWSLQMSPGDSLCWQQCASGGPLL